MVPDEYISALISEADPDRFGRLRMPQFIVLMKALNPVHQSNARIAAERERARLWMHSKMCKQKAIWQWRNIFVVMTNEMLRRMVTRWAMFGASELKQLCLTDCCGMPI